MEYSEIKNAIEKFNRNNIVNEIAKPIYIDKRKGNRYELDQFNWTMKCKNYREKRRQERLGYKVRKKEEVNSIDEIQNMILKNELSQSWSRLEKHHKLENINKFISSLNLDKDTNKKVKVFVYTKYKAGKLKSNKSVVYDKETCEIKDIPLLKEYIKTLS